MEQAYMDLLAFERKLDSTIMRKRLDIQEALKRPMKQKRKLRIFISNTSFPAKEGAEGGAADDNTAGNDDTVRQVNSKCKKTLPPNGFQGCHKNDLQNESHLMCLVGHPRSLLWRPLDQVWSLPK